MTVAPPTQVSVKIVKSLPRRGSTVQWSNRYFFNGPDAWTSAEFNTVADALAAIEKTLFSTAVVFGTAVGYNGHSDVPVFSRDESGVTPTYTHTGQPRTPSDTAAVLRFATDQRSVKNHPIYLYKYYHDVFIVDDNTPETINSNQVTRYSSAITSLLAGINDGTQLRKLCGPRGAVALSGTLLANTRHRDFRN